ncbi:MAG TPA: hypothetical protein VF881_14040 [Polyangiaceae bacterium]
MLGQYSIRNVLYERTIYIRMSGRFDAALMREFAVEYGRITDEYQGKQHLVLADMRGMAPLLPEVGQIFEGGIGYARARGVMFCVHLTDNATQKWQADRLARRATPANDVTLNVETMEEALSALEEARLRVRRSSSFPPASATIPTSSPVVPTRIPQFRR